MNKILSSVLFFLFSVVIFGQKISGRVTSENKSPINGVRIGIENEEIGGFSDENGLFEIDLKNIDQSKNLKVFENGFEIFQTKISNFISSNHNIILKEKINNIEPIIINPKKFKVKNYGTSNSKSAFGAFDSEKRTQIFREYAIKVENKRNLKIKRINVNFVSFKFEKPVTLIFDIQNSKNGYPDDSQSLANEPLQLTINEKDIKNNTVSIDVSDKNIWANKDFFVTVRVNEDFKGKLYFGGNMFAFSKHTYYRNYYGAWQRYSVGEPSINVDVLIEK